MMDKELALSVMATSTKENLDMVYFTEKESLSGQTKQDILVLSTKTRSQELVVMTGQMAVHTQEKFLTDLDMAKELMSTLKRVLNTKENGSTDSDTVMVNLNTAMGLFIKANGSVV